MSAVATAGGLPTRLGKYEIVTPLAAGGMARIYIGRATGIGSFERHVVLKVILPERAQDVASVQMFLDEARLAASLNHQNVAQVFEVGHDAGMHFLAMEYVHGQDLRAVLAKAGHHGARVPLELALTMVAGAAAGLHHAHERRTSDGLPMGIVHRDVSPSNIMVGYDGAVKLLDFGIAKATLRSIETQSGVIKGKFAYMSPEQCRGREVDARSDVFSLGIILYEVTTQHRCFRADSDFDTMHRIVTGDVHRPTRLVPGYPQALEAIVMKALTIDVQQRYQSAGLLLEALESFALASRMSLSTMALGRFMRDLFGEVREPWLITGRVHKLTPPREGTISNTNATGSGQLPAPVPGSLPPPVDAAEVSAALMHAAAPLHLPIDSMDSQAATQGAAALHDAPTTATAPVDPSDADPTSAVREVPPAVDDPDSDARRQVGYADQPGFSTAPTASAGHPPAPPPPGLPDGLLAPAMVSGAVVWPHGTQPLPSLPGPGLAQPGPPVFTSRGSSSAPLHTAVQPHPVVTAITASPGGTGPIGMSEPQALDVHTELRTNRWLYTGLGIVLVGVVALVGVAVFDEPPAERARSARSGAGDVVHAPEAPQASPPQAAPAAGSTPKLPAAAKPVTPVPAAQPAAPARPAPPSAQVASRPVAPTPPAAPRPAPPAPAAPADQARTVAPAAADEMITIRVQSTPPGAEVLLADTALGTTPFTLAIKRQPNKALLTIRRPRYAEVSMMIDLSRDYESDLKLAPLAEDPPRPAVRATPRPQPAARKCQPPDRLNPFDTSCGGDPCPVCKS